MSGIIEEILEEAEDVVGAAVGDVERAIEPRAGGKIDTARRNRDAASLQDLPAARTDALVRGRPVAVDPLAPETGTARIVTLSTANPVLPLLGADTSRRAATLLAVDNDVYVSHDFNLATQAAASAGATFDGCGYLPAGIAVPWESSGPLWAAVTTTGTSSRITVMASFRGN
jgi:hypothetical protein